MVPYLNRIPIFEWWVVRFTSKKQTLERHGFKVIDLQAQILLPIKGSIVQQIWDDLCDYSKKKNLDIKSEQDIPMSSTLNITRKMDTA